MAGEGADIDAGLAAALKAAGGIRPLARKLGGLVTRQAVQNWARVPQERVFAVAEVTGIPATELRPDLEDWILEERRRLRFAAARERFGLAIAAAGVDAAASTSPFSLDELAIDILVTMTAVVFVGQERGLAPARIMGARDREALAAKSWAMALAHVVGRARASNIGLWFGSSRQNVDNACERYLRARDGDDPEAYFAGADGGARVIERGRVRRAKAAEGELWEAERRFADQLDRTEPERKRA